MWIRAYFHRRKKYIEIKQKLSDSSMFCSEDRGACAGVSENFLDQVVHDAAADGYMYPIKNVSK